MADAKWGRKHVCLGCQAAFYDMRRSPITCPKCGVVHEPVAVLKSDGRPPRRRRLPPTSTPAKHIEPGEAPAASEREGPATDAASEVESDDTELIVEDDAFEPDEAGEDKA
jgi:uncharacterized protein (TIGR02300 family)